MSIHLLIAGHGRKQNGVFDSGATGYVAKGENKYMTEDLFPAMKKYAEQSKDTFIFFEDYNVYDRANLIALAQKYDADTVTEYHFDATGNSDASGGHVIVHSDFKPDKLDLALRDVIGEVVGLAYPIHHGEKGISGRSNLQNVNLAKSGGVNYRLLELGFGTNKKDADIMINNVEEYAKKLILAYDANAKVNTSNETKPAPAPTKPVKKSAEQVAQDIAVGKGGWGNNPERKRKLTEAGYNAEAIQKRVNEILAGKSKPAPKPNKKTVEEVAQDIVAGRGNWGNNPERAKKLRNAGYDPDAVQKIVNDIITGRTKKKSINQAVKDVIDGKYKNEPERTRLLKADGFTQSEINQIQREVNKRF